VLPHFLFNETELLTFALVLLRVSAFIVSWPVFSVYSVPAHLKILFSLLVAMVLFPVISRTGLGAHQLHDDIALLACKEVLVGVCLGFLTRLFFFAVSVGGNLISTSMGLASAQVFNPALGNQSLTVEQFHVTLATLIFLALNGHHFFLTGLAQSFEALPLAEVGIKIATTNLSGVEFGGTILQKVTEAGIRISAPVMVAIFFMNMAMGIMGRAVPQINVLITSLPVNILSGLVVMIVAIPALVFELDHQVIEFAEMLFKFMKAF
jgi:flagellar biosynthetic protein FliR